MLHDEKPDIPLIQKVDITPIQKVALGVGLLSWGVCLTNLVHGNYIASAVCLFGGNSVAVMVLFLSALDQDPSH